MIDNDSLFAQINHSQSNKSTSYNTKEDSIKKKLLLDLMKQTDEKHVKNPFKHSTNNVVKLNNSNHTLATANATNSKSQVITNQPRLYKKQQEPAKMNASNNIYMNLKMKNRTQSNGKIDMSDSFWSFNDRSLLNTLFKDSSVNNSSINNKSKSTTNNDFAISSSTASKNSLNVKQYQSINIEKLINKLENESKKSVSTSNSIHLDENSKNKQLEIDSNVMKWSNQLNKTNKLVTFGSKPVINEFEPSNFDRNLSKSNMNLPNELVEKSDEVLDSERTKRKSELRPASTIKTVFDLIERENTAFSVKMQYDNIMNRCDSLTPHAYMGLDKDSKLKLTRENTMRNADLKIVELEEESKENWSNKQANQASDASQREKKRKDDYVSVNRDYSSIDIYQILEKPKRINVYSELDSTISFNSSPSTNFNQQNQKLIVNKKKLSIKKANSFKQNSLVKQIENNLDKDNIKSSINLDQISNKATNNEKSAFESFIMSESQMDLSTDFASNNDWSLLNEEDKFYKYNSNHPQQQRIANEKLKLGDQLLLETLKNKAESIKSPKKSSTKSNKKGKLNTKKKVLKEFNYCVLTDLKIGEGEFSETFQGYRYDMGTPIRIAAKRLKNFKDDQTKLNFISEISVLTHLGIHENVIEYLGVYCTNNSMYMVFEYAEKGDLKRLLDQFRKNQKREINITNLFKLKVAYEVASGMEYISNLEIVHKDLAARNILLDSDFNCKISDFGCCKTEFLNKRPIRWMAPESFNKYLFTTASDVWSYGVLLWELYTFGMTPYPGMTDDEVIGRINQWYRLFKPQDCPNEIYSIMLSCWKDYRQARPRFTHLKNKFRDLYRIQADSPNNNRYNKLNNEYQ